MDFFKFLKMVSGVADRPYISHYTKKSAKLKNIKFEKKETSRQF